MLEERLEFRDKSERWIYKEIKREEERIIIVK